MIDLMRFTDRYRQSTMTQTPLLYKNHAIATNGHIIAIAQTEKTYPAMDLELDFGKRYADLIDIVLLATPSEKLSIDFDQSNAVFCTSCAGGGYADKFYCPSCSDESTDECDVCHDSGFVFKVSKNPCPNCHGLGFYYNTEKFNRDKGDYDYLHINVLGSYFNPNYLALIANEPELRVCIENLHNRSHPVLIYHALTIKGLIMPVRM